MSNSISTLFCLIPVWMMIVFSTVTAYGHTNFEAEVVFCETLSADARDLNMDDVRDVRDLVLQTAAILAEDEGAVDVTRDGLIDILDLMAMVNLTLDPADTAFDAKVALDESTHPTCPSMSCGDGECTEDESFESCPEDCEMPTLAPSGPIPGGAQHQNRGHSAQAEAGFVGFGGAGAQSQTAKVDLDAAELPTCPRDRCGNGICGEGESFETCADDCPLSEDGDTLPWGSLF